MTDLKPLTAEAEAHWDREVVRFLESGDDAFFRILFVKSAQQAATIEADRETIRELTEQRDAFQAQAEYERQARIDAANFPRNRHGYIACMRCGLDCGMDAIIPDDAWALIAPDESGGGMFCLWCMDELLAEKGMRNIPVALYFPGKALLSLLYDDVADAIRTLAEAVCAAVEGE